MKNYQRPLSPHIQIYKWQWSMISSISNRVTGILFCLALVMIFAMMVAVHFGGVSFEIFQLLFSSFLGYFAQILLLFVVTYHAFAGIQHLFWDFGKGFDYSLQQHRLRTIITFVASISSTLLIFITTCH